MTLSDLPRGAESSPGPGDGTAVPSWPAWLLVIEYLPVRPLIVSRYSATEKCTILSILTRPREAASSRAITSEASDYGSQPAQSARSPFAATENSQRSEGSSAARRRATRAIHTEEAGSEVSEAPFLLGVEVAGRSRGPLCLPH